jgi:outer membrane protein TolC
MPHPVRLLLLVLAAVVPLSAAAQEPLALDQAVQAALTQNASLRGARATRDEADAQAKEARAGFFPRVTFTESWQRGDQPVFVFSSLLSARRFGAEHFAIDALNHPDPIGFFRGTLGVEQLIFDGGRRRAATDATALRRDVAGLATDEAAAGLALAATQTFGRVIAAQAAHRHAEAGIEAAREDLARAERRRDAGMVTDADVLGLAVHVADLQQRAIQAIGDGAIARAELNRLMGVPIDRDYQLVEPTVIEGVRGAEAQLDALFAEADAARPEIRRAAATQQLADAGRRQARAALIPQVAAQAGFDVSGTRINDRASSWLVGGEVRWTISLGGAELAQTKAAIAAAARARAEADDARSAVHVEVVSALRRLEAARARQAVGRAAVDQARESQRIIRDRFDAGIVGVNDVLRASMAVLDAETQRVSALVDATDSDAMLRRALGRTR